MRRSRWLKRTLAIGGVAGAAMLFVSCIHFGPEVSSRASTASSARSVDVVFADVTGDGVDDPIVTTNDVAEGNVPVHALVRLASCGGGGCYEPREEIPLGAPIERIDFPNYPREVVTADFDGDSVADVAVVTSAGANVYFGGAAEPGRPEGLRADDVVTVLPGGVVDRVVTADFNGDGNADLATLQCPSNCGGPVTLSITTGDGAGGFAAPFVVFEAEAGLPGVNDIAAGDVDGDGDAEVLEVEHNRFNVYVRAFDDGGNLVAEFDYTPSTLTGYPRLAVDDVNGDGLDDVALVRIRSHIDFPGVPPAATFVDVLRSTGTAFELQTTLTVNNTDVAPALDLELRDIDLDDNIDVRIADGTQLSWWPGNGDGSFGTQVQRDAGPVPGALAFGNLGRPRPDLIVANPTTPFAQVSFLRNASR